MKKPTLWQRIRYRFDNLMSKGTPSLLLIPALITIITVLIGGILSLMLGGPDGSGIYMKPVTRYVHTEGPVDFYTLCASAARYGEIAIGYKKFAEDGSFSIEINPRIRSAVKYSEQDDVIVIAANPE